MGRHAGPGQPLLPFHQTTMQKNLTHSAPGYSFSFKPVQCSIPEKFRVKSTPALPFGWRPWTFHHTVPSDLVSQPVATAVTHDKFIQEH